MREIVELSGGASGSTKARIANQERAFRPFPEARAFVHKLDLKDAWGTYAKSGRKPQDIPASPNKAYDSSEWRG